MATTYLTRTPSGTGSQTKFTFSFWWKNNCNHGSDKCFFSSGLNSSNYFMIRTTGNEQLELLALDNGNATMRYKPTRFYRDNNAWYHIVIAVDTTQSGGNRLKWYTNGVRETAFDLSTEPNQSSNILYVNDTTTHCIGRKNVTSDKYMDGTLSHYHFIDGTQYAASDFGSTDSTTGNWKINVAPSVTYGTNGFFILKDGNSVTDQSGNSNNWSVGGGTLTKTEDCPSNIFCTGNPLARYGGNVNYSEGNNKITGSANNWTMGSATMGASTGKYYFECKILSAGTGSGYTKFGFISDEAFASGGVHVANTDLDGGYAFYQQNGNLEVRTNDAVITGYDGGTLSTSLTNNDVMCVAVDMDNKKAYMRKNGDAWIKSADPVNGTNGLDISSDYPVGSNKKMIPAWAIYYPGTAALNFGNGYFGTTAVSSAGTNASNIGIFEYDVPTGYTALSTKGLNE